MSAPAATDAAPVAAAAATPAVVAAPAFRGPLRVEYCAACSMPPEYCEFGPCFDRCRVLLEKKHPDLLAAALEKMKVSASAAAGAAAATSTTAAAAAPAGEENKEGEKKEKAKKTRFDNEDDEDDDEDDDDESDDDEAGPSSSAAAAADGDDEFLSAAAPVKAPLKKSAPSGPGLYLSLSQRSKRKFITTIRGWESFGIVLKDVAKILAKKFACAASIVKTGDGSGSEIAIQGDLMMDLPQWIIDEYKQVDKKLVWTLDKAGKKCKAF